MTDRQVRTRFAPSPTGFLHIGGVRTALFNWLVARAAGGAFVLRIDDTDVKRNMDEALGPILEGFRWLGIDWDEGPEVPGTSPGSASREVPGTYGPYFQSQRLERYQAAAAELVRRGHAYWDYATTEEIQAEREAAQQAGERFLYSRRWRAKDDADRRRFEAEGRAGVVRLEMPRDGVCRFTDLIRGEMEFDWAREQDHVIQRADGTCLYHLASVVDDEAMAISDVIRAEEHLSNTPRQIFIARGLGYELPRYAHLPYVAEPGSRSKLSKRKLDKYLKNPDFARLNEHGQKIASAIGLETEAETFNPVIVDFYEQIGFLPAALLNYLLLLGWALDDRTETFSVDEMIVQFSLERVNRAPASFDPVKLMAFQERYMQALPAAERTELCLPFVEKAGWVATPPSESERRRVGRIVAAAGDRIKVAGDVLDYSEFFVADDELAYEEKPFHKRLVKPESAADVLVRYRARLAGSEALDAGGLEQMMVAFTADEEIKIGQIIHAVRVAVTGKAVGFGMFEILEILGRESCLARIDRALERVAAEANR